MPDREKAINSLTDIEQIMIARQGICPREELQYWIELKEGVADALALLKEQEAKERKWLQAIADNQLANAPKDSPMSLDEQLESEYKSGIYDGLQMAFEILMEGR